MRIYITFVIILVLYLQTICQQTESQITSEPGENLITFTYTTLTVEKPGQSDFSVAGDTVSFTLYYVDITCYNYTYEFERDGKSLIVRRVTKEPDGCDKETEQLYGFEGKLVNVPSGKHLFELESLIGDVKNTIFREVIRVK